MLANDRVFFNPTGDPTAWANIEKGWASGTWDGSKVTNTDWGAIVKQNSITSDNLFSVSGGTDKLKAYASLDYLNNTGTIKGQSFQRYTAKVNLDHLVYYDKSVGEHTFGTTLLASQTQFRLDGQSVTGNGVPLESQRWNALTSGVLTGQLTRASNLVETQLLSYIARLNYSYKDRYLLTVSARQDGASMLAEGINILCSHRRPSHGA